MSQKRVIDALIKDVNKHFAPEGSKPIAKRASELDPVVRIPMESPALNYITGGGWVRGQLHELFGPEHSGKTSTALLGLRDCLRWEAKHGDPTKVVAFIDIEHRYNSEWAEKLGLVQDENLVLIQPPDAESGTDVMIRLIKSQRVSAIVFDSVGAALPAYAHNEFRDKNTRQGGNASVMTRNVNTISPIANLYNVTVIYLNQLRADMAGYNRPMTPGGHAVKHQMSLRIYLRPGRDRYYDKISDGVNKETQVGHPILFRVVKNSYGAAYKQQWSDFYNQSCRWVDSPGFDRENDLQRLGVLTGVITQSGSYYSYKDVREQGREKMFAALKEANRWDEFESDIYTALSNSGIVDVEEMPESDEPDITESV